MISGLACCSAWACKESDMTEALNNKFRVVVICHSFPGIFYSLFDFFFWLFRCLLFSSPPCFCVLCSCSFVFSCSWYIILQCFGHKKCLQVFQFLKTLPGLVLWPTVWSGLRNVPHALEKKSEFYCF